MFGLLDWIKLGAGAVAGALLAAGPLYLIGKHDGRLAERAEILTRSVEILRERNATDDEIKGMDDAALCAALGGVFADGACE